MHVVDTTTANLIYWFDVATHCWFQPLLFYPPPPLLIHPSISSDCIQGYGKLEDDVGEPNDLLLGFVPLFLE